MSKPHSKVLEFLKKWQAWALAGGEKDVPFSPCMGLCSNLAHWMEDNNVFDEEAFIAEDDLSTLLKDEAFPFNKDALHYVEECRAGKAHLNPERLHWVSKIIKEAEQ